MTTISVSEARAILPALLDRVGEGDEVTLTRHGQPVAVLVRPDMLRARRTGDAVRLAEEVRGRLEAARHQPLPPGGLAPGRADELAAQLRAERDARG